MDWTKDRLIALASRLAGRELGGWQAACELKRHLGTASCRGIYTWYQGKYQPTRRLRAELERLELRSP